MLQLRLGLGLGLWIRVMVRSRLRFGLRLLKTPLARELPLASELVEWTYNQVLNFGLVLGLGLGLVLHG